MNINGTHLYNAVRHLAPVAKSSLQPCANRLRLRSVGDQLEVAAVGRNEDARVFLPSDGEALTETAWIDGDVLRKLSPRWKKRDVQFEQKADGSVELGIENVVTTFPKSDGPVMADLETAEAHVVLEATPELFADVMSKALPYASKDDSRPALCCVQIEHVGGDAVVTATDGATLYTRTINAGGDEEAIVPAHLFKLALKLMDVKADARVSVFSDDRLVTIEQRGVFVASTEVVTATYPDFRQCLPNRATMPLAEFDVAAMRDALDTASAFVSKSNAVRVTYNGSVRVCVEGEDGSFDADLAGQFEGSSPVTLSFNRDYLLRACGTVGRCGTVRQFVGDALAPQLFEVQGSDQDELVVVMPMRL